MNFSDFFYFESKKDIKQEVIYIFFTGNNDNKKHFYRVPFKCTFNDIFKPDNLVWSIENSLVPSCYYLSITSKMF